MKLNYKKLLQQTEDFLNSEEGKRYFKEFANKKEQQQKLKDSQLNRFHEKYSSRFEELVLKVSDKYNSDKYIDRWRRRHIEPPETLFWFFYEYAKTFGRKSTLEEDKEYGNMFTTSLYYVKGYFFNRMDGQGSVIQIEKENENII